MRAGNDFVLKQLAQQERNEITPAPEAVKPPHVVQRVTASHQKPSPVHVRPRGSTAKWHYRSFGGDMVMLMSHAAGSVMTTGS
jgi:hypothetical protein